MLWQTRSICGTWVPSSYLMELRKSLKSLARVSMGWPASSAQLSNRYTTGTPSATRYWARLPNVVAEVVATGHALVKPVSQPFSSTTGGRAEPVGTVARCLAARRAAVACAVWDAAHTAPHRSRPRAASRGAAEL